MTCVYSAMRGGVAWRLAALLLAGVSMGGGDRLSENAVPPQRLRALYERPVDQWPPAVVAPGVAYVELGPLPAMPAPDVARAELGRRLFFDPTLSRQGDISCATCHDPARGWSNGQALGVGGDPLAAARNVPGLVGVARRAHFGWDGREIDLARQSLRPLIRSDEMGNADLGMVTERIASRPDHAALFTAAFAAPNVGTAQVGDALAAFLASLDVPNRFDAFLRGDHAVLSDEEIVGLHLFRTRAGCVNCHFGPLLTDEGFHNLGLSAFGEPREDLGRYGVTRRSEDAGRFRTPSLRQVATTGPYMHGGLFPSIRGVVRFYAGGGGRVWARNAREAARPLFEPASRIDPLLRPFSLDEVELAALVAFLRAL